MNYVHGDKEQARALAEQLAALASGLAAAPSNVAEMRNEKYEAIVAKAQ
jgi:hypothetical protein